MALAGGDGGLSFSFAPFAKKIDSREDDKTREKIVFRLLNISQYVSTVVPNKINLSRDGESGGDKVDSNKFPGRKSHCATHQVARKPDSWREAKHNNGPSSIFLYPRFSLFQPCTADHAAKKAAFKDGRSSSSTEIIDQVIGTHHSYQGNDGESVNIDETRALRMRFIGKQREVS